MSTEAPLLNEVFFMTVHQQIITAPTVGWANTFAFEVTDVISSRESLTMAAMTCVDFCRMLLLESNAVERVVVSAAVELPFLPTTPSDFYIVDYGGAGYSEGGVASERCDLDVVMHIRRAVYTGSWGHLYMRGCLLESDVQAPSGKLSYNNPTAQASRVQSALVDSGLLDYVGETGALPGLNLITYRPGTVLPPVAAVVKFVTGLTSHTVTRRKFNKAYYDRGVF